jgi:sarcosine oxidase subunit beta
MTGDRLPIISKPMLKAFVNCGWGTGGSRPFRVRAMSLPTPSPMIGRTQSPSHSTQPFAEGRLIDESVAAAVAH